MADTGPGGEVARAEELHGAMDDQVEKLARKLLQGGDGNHTAAGDIEAARKQARRMLEESEARTRQAAGVDPNDDGVIRRSSAETAASGENAAPRATEE